MQNAPSTSTASVSTCLPLQYCAMHKLHCALAAIEAATGLTLSLLSARDEAHLGFVGPPATEPLSKARSLTPGGGSTELTRIEGGRDFDNVSIPQGSLSSYATFVRAILPSPSEMDTIESAFRTHLGSPACQTQKAYVHPCCMALAVAYVRQQRCMRKFWRKRPSEVHDGSRHS